MLWCKHLCPISYFSKKSLISKVQYFQVPLFFPFVLSSPLLFFLMVVGISAREEQRLHGNLVCSCPKSPLFPCSFSCFQRIRILILDFISKLSSIIASVDTAQYNSNLHILPHSDQLARLETEKTQENYGYT